MVVTVAGDDLRSMTLDRGWRRRGRAAICHLVKFFAVGYPGVRAGGGGMEEEPLPGFYPDPDHPGEERYWTGDRWSSFRRHTEEPAPPPPARGSPAYEQAQSYQRSGRRRRTRRYVILAVVLAVVAIAIGGAIVAI